MSCKNLWGYREIVCIVKGRLKAEGYNVIFVPNKLNRSEDHIKI